MNHPVPPPTDIPPGFFQFTRWSTDPRETFPVWRVHFAALGIRCALIHAGDLVALYREGEETRDDSTKRWRAWRNTKLEDEVIRTKGKP